MTVAYPPIPTSQHLPDNAVTVHKFGGTSVGGPSQFVQVRDLVVRLSRGNKEKPVIVVSAMSGVTTKLYNAITLAVSGADFEKCLNEVFTIHADCLSQLAVDSAISSAARDSLTATVKTDIHSISDHLAIVSKSHKCPALIEDVIVAYGEIWSSQILSLLVSSSGLSSEWVNARDFLFLSPLSGKDVRIDWKRSHAPVALGDGVPVITGFLATSSAGLPTTLKRNGSDHSGAIVANLCKAACLTIWTDVDGIYSADPRVVPDARMVKTMSYKEAAELAYFGAKVIHPQTMAPCVSRNIPVVLRNTFNLACTGTAICAVPEQPARAATIIPEIALVNVEGSGLFGFSGIAAKLFAAVAAADTNIVMITQASSEYSICFAVPVGDASVCADAVRLAFAAEIADGGIDVTVDASAAIVAAVGDGMHQQVGLLGTLASALGEMKVNVRAVAQGSSERNITFVVNKSEGVLALRSIHAALVPSL